MKKKLAFAFFHEWRLKKIFCEKNWIPEECKKANEGICPYTGQKISGGEIDHILPRRSKYGTINDEANLIYSSKVGNQHKSNNFVSFDSGIHLEYMKKIFSTNDPKRYIVLPFRFSGS